MKLVRKSAVILFWLVFWFFISRVVKNSLILADPVDVVLALGGLLPEKLFWLTLGNSLLRIGLGLFMGFSAGVVLGILSYRCPLVGEILAPLISLMKAVPVASFVIIALIFMGSRNLSVLIVFILVTPIVYHSTREGFAGIPADMLEMADVFQIHGINRLRFIDFPAVFPHWISSVKTVVGMSWKSGVAAEVIGVSAGSVGEQLYLAKIYLETANVYAWTIVIIFMSLLCEKGCLWLLGRLQGASYD